MKPLSILFATSEMAPWVKTGGLGDVASALPEALRRIGHDIRVLLPAYPALKKAFPEARLAAEIPALAPGLPACRLLTAQDGQLSLLLLDCPSLYDRPGNPYLDTQGQDWTDNAIRFGLLSRIAARLGQTNSPIGWQADIVHCNDWQTALAPAWLHYDGGAASIVTVHNIAFQGCFGRDMLTALGLPEHAWRFDHVEYHGQLSFLKAGLQLASQLSTVSPTYAREIQDEHFGYGLAPLLRHRAAELRGILNGVDTDIWNPATDPALTAGYAANRLAAKRANKTALQSEMGLEVTADRPLFGVISRLTHQKGLDLLLTVGDGIASLPAQLVVLGSGDKEMEAGFRTLAERFPGQVAVRIGFDEGLAHRIEEIGRAHV
jgi:starch synthase